MGANKDQFLERYAVVDFWGQVVGHQNTDELASKFGLLAYRIDKRKVLDLPPITVVDRRFSLSPKALELYTTFGKDLALSFESGELTAGNSLVKLLRLQQMTGGYVPIETPEGGEKIEEIDDGKRNLFAEILADLPEGEPIVVFCRFRHDLDNVAAVAKLAGREYRELSGKVNELKAWQAESIGSVLGVQIQAGGVGVDGTRAAYVVFYSIGFSLADYEQAKARLDRPGQTRPVTAINLIAAGTVDEAVYGSISKKGDVVEGVIQHLRGL
jgi:SNF2 family DNA or RNA helicase